MKSKIVLLCCLSVLMLCGTAAASSSDPLAPFKGEKGVIRIAGGTAHIPVVKEAAKRIMRFNPEIQITVAGGGSGLGIKKVGEGLVDIGNSGRKPKDAEIQRYGLSMFKWAVDGVAVAVNPENPVQSLSGTQLREIFSGKIDNWKALGGKDRAINLYTRDKSSGTRAVFWKKALSKGEISQAANFVVSNGAMKTAVANDPYAIGYVSVGHIDKSIAPVTLDDIAPTLENVKSGKYKVARGLYSNTKGNPSGLTGKFIDYLFSDEIQEVAVKKGFISVK